MSSVRFQNLDKLRGFAAMSVLVYHVIEIMNWTDFPTQGVNVWWRIGWMGVNLFFVLSGFVIYFSAHTLKERYGQSWGRVYAAHRFARIAPLYFLTLFVFSVLVLPALLFIPPVDLALQFFTHVFFIHNLLPSTQGAINGVNWSIGVEMQFYVFMFLCLGWLQQVSIGRVLVVLCGIACSWKAAIFLFFPADQRWFLTTQLPGTLDEFAFGIAACKLILEQKLVVAPIWIHRWWRIILAIASLWLMFTIFWMEGDYWNSPWMVIFFRTLMAFSGATLILVVITIPEHWWMASSKPFDYLGKISYGIYLWHLPVILSLKTLDLAAGVPYLTAVIVGTLLLAAFSYHMLESPWIERARRAG